MELPDFSLPHAEKIEWMIESAGWAIESVPAQTDSDPPVPGYSYTIGFPAAFGFAEVLEEARRFLSLPQLDPVPNTPSPKLAPAPSGSSEAARRLLSMSRPLKGSLAATYLRSRGITDLRDTGALKLHPNCYYRGQGEDQTETWPAMIAALDSVRCSRGGSR